MMTALIPAYNPGRELIDIVRALADSEIAAVIVVNDGSKPECDPIFGELRELKKVTLLRHAVNLGKGAALKTGLNWAYCAFPEHIGVVTLDADGQHLLPDVINVANLLHEHPDSLVVGSRAFDKDVPARSKIGNNLTRILYRLLMGQKLTDTQSGLRGIPLDFIPRLLRIDANGYEYELDMLLSCKYTGRPIIEQPISTVYIEDNKSSHFNPLIDSMKIYFVLFRFSLASLLSALIDNTVFVIVYSNTSSIFAGQATARLIATLYNYTAVRKIVFYSSESKAKTFPRYLMLVCMSGAVSYLLIKIITMYTPLSVIAAKIMVESVVFLANFAIQRDFIFTGHKNLSNNNN
jgi:glycosyltransferase involved in cell wall biosynthesis